MPSNIEVLLSRLKGVKKQGKEWVAHCPAHSDSTPSLGIRISDTGKVLIHCLADCTPADILAAIDLQLSDLFPDRKMNGHVQPVPVAEPERITCAPPIGVNTPILLHPAHGKPTILHVYTTLENKLLGYVMRFDLKEGKTFCPLTYSAADGWKFKAFSKPRPLYGLGRLRERSDGARFVVEGEKTADALQALVPKNAVLSWCGGAGAAKHADLSPLAGQPVILWPDADEPGRKAVDELAERLSALRCNIRIVDTEGLLEGFDAADLKEPLKPWLTPRLRAYTPRADPTTVPESGSKSEALVARPVASVTPITEARTRQQAKPVTEPDTLPAKYSHDALAAAFTAANPDLRHVKEWGRWLYWSGTYWEQDTTGKVDHLARQICRGQAEEAKASDASYSTVRSIVHVATISAVEKLARADPAHARSTDHWDSDPWLLNTPGGIVDLRDGSLRPGRPEDHQTKITRATPTGDCPQWCQFLIDATRGDGDLISFLGRMSGYWLTASIREHALFFFHGPGGNGKGTFLNTLAWVLGDYAGIAAMDMLTEQHNQQHLTFQAALKGRRLVVAQEVEEGKRWAEAKLNSLTGGDPITANYMRHDPFTFLPTHKFAISGNHKPIIRNVGDAIRRRMNLIPFTNKPTVPDKDLPEKLQAEAGGILRWAIAGCLEWQRFGLNPPEIVRAATAKYLASQDSMTTWITECCEDFTLRTPLKELFDSYKAWCAANGETELGRKRFVEAIETRGHEVIEDRKHYFVRGLKLTAEGSPQSSRFQD